MSATDTSLPLALLARMGAARRESLVGAELDGDLAVTAHWTERLGSKELELVWRLESYGWERIR